MRHAPARPQRNDTRKTRGSNRAERAVFRACRGLPVEYTPVWLMQQANHSPHSVAEIVASPELAAELTLQPAERFGVDAVALCSEVSLPLGGMGMQLDLNDRGRRARRRAAAQHIAIDLLATPPAEEHLSPDAGCHPPGCR